MNTKPFWQSKTLWTQLLAVVSLLIPAVQEWVVSNPVDAGAVFAAVNVVVRFVTHGKISPFPAGDGGGGKNFLLVIGMGVLASGLVLSQTSCSSSLMDVEGTIFYRDEGTGAKGGFDFVPGQKPKAWWRLPMAEPEREPVVDAAK